MSEFSAREGDRGTLWQEPRSRPYLQARRPAPRRP